jgi:putative transposase
MKEDGPPSYCSKMIRKDKKGKEILVFENDNFYHCYNRGVDKREIFLDNSDFARFVHYLYALNDITEYENLSRTILKSNEGGRTSLILNADRGEKIVDVVCFCLMPNHYHLLLSQRIDGGITKFMRKLGTAYAMYFNGKYERSGTLFQGRFKAINVSDDEYLRHLTRYIHLNPLDMVDKKWREGMLSNSQKSLDYLEKYKWSSYRDYIGQNNFPSVIDPSNVKNFFESGKDYKLFVESWAEGDLDDGLERVILE